MKKLVLSLAIASTLGLTACDDETIKDVQQEVAENGSAVTASARVIFDPSNGVLSVPNDLLFSGSQDGTLNIPVTDPTNGGDPFVALNALDGWSTVNPFVLGIDFPEGTELDGNSVFNPASVRIFEATMGGDLVDADCSSVQRGLACKIVGELTFGVDFIAQKSGHSIAVVPLKPLKGKSTYLLALTNNIQDTNGRAVDGSTTYELVRQDITTKPLGSEAQLGLQAVINSYEKAVTSAGVDSESIIYTSAMTTQSTIDVLATIKSVMAGNAQLGVVPTIGVQDTGASVADILNGVIPDSLVPLYSTANYMQGSITLPYYLGVPTAENPMAPVNEWWTSLCDSAAMLAGLAAANPAAIPENPVSVNDGTCMAIAQAAGLPAPGLRDLSTVLPLDTERNLTKYSPVPAPKAMTPLTVQVTTPDISPVTDAVRASFGLPALTAMPENGWPVVILQHGITSKKEDMLAVTGILSTFGFATVAIDHPLHGSRGFDLNPAAEGDEINASTVSATHYMNLASLLTTRDNLRQSTADILGLRFGLNFLGGVDLNGNPIKVDTTNVHFLGHSLGAITGINFMALTNSPLNPAIDPMFNVVSNSLAMPGIMVANFLMESGAFGDVIKASLTLAQSTDFQAFVIAQYPPLADGQVHSASEAELVGAYRMFYDALSPTQQAGLEGIFAQFAFAAQTVTDSGDPINYIAAMAATQTPTHLIEVVGNGVDNLSDQVIPNTVSTAPLAGTEGAVALLGLSGVSETSQGSGAVRFLVGHHGSILSPSPRPEASDPVMTGRATQEMQSQVVGFFATMGQLIQVTDTDIVY
ncbi:VolA/Pla-1 family phospholipase [Colwelliaceae bacterium 6471]